MRQYFAKTKEDNKLYFNEEDVFHLSKVLRMKNDDFMDVVFENKKYNCLLKIEKDIVYAVVIKEVEDSNELECKVTLIQGLLKGAKFDLVIQKAVELGVSTIVPFLSSRSVVNLNDDKIENKVKRWNKIAYEASKQSNRNIVPNVLKPIYIDNLDNYKSSVNIIAYEDEKNTSTTNLYNLLSDKLDVSIIVGPEGGFSPKEVKEFEDKGFKVVSLGKRILRSETASMYLLSVISFMLER